jgi:hypothetical protein
MQMTSKRKIGLAGLLAMLALMVPSGAAASVPAVTVFGSNDQMLAKFTTAKCRKGTTRKGSFFAKAISTNGQYEIDVAIYFAFTGLHEYDLALEPEANPYLRFSVEGDESGYSNEFVPPFPVPGFGQIRFSPNGKRMGIGFGPAMWNRDASDSVVLAGGLKCRYPKKRR